MVFDKSIETFIKNYVNDISENSAAIFAGAGMSRSAGYVNWPELLRDIASELGLDIDKEHDLISVAQYHVNEKGGRAGLNRKILHEFSEEAETTENHKILSRLPITTFWTTNYDVLIENSLKEANKIADVKHEVDQLSVTRPKRDAVIYKMHGDVSHPTKAVITKEQYENYHKTHEPFITALSGDLISKTFLFIGFSFTDPNLDYVLSRLNFSFKENLRNHYCFVKRHSKSPIEDDGLYKYNLRKQELMIGELKRYKIEALLINEYSEITDILSEIEYRFRKKTIFISGSAEDYGRFSRIEAQKLIHLLSKQIISSGYRIVNGFGWGVGSAVINGALEAIYEKPEKFSEDQLIIKPFPQFETGSKKLDVLWEDYRQRMLSFAGVSIFIFGNKLNKEGEIITANGVIREFEIAIEQGLIPIPIASTGNAAKQIYEIIIQKPEEYYHNHNKALLPLIAELASEDINIGEIVDKITKIIKYLNQ